MGKKEAFFSTKEKGGKTSRSESVEVDAKRGEKKKKKVTPFARGEEREEESLISARP